MTTQLIKPEPRIRLYPYQAKLVDELRLAYREDECPCLVLPTAGGKTVICAALAQSATDRSRKLWFCVHQDFLVLQTVKTFQEMGLSFGVMAPGYPESDENVQIVSIPTLYRRRAKLLNAPRPDVAVWDECHHTPSASWRACWDWMGVDCFHMGLTATPCRLDGRGLAPAKQGEAGFTRLILGPSVRELMDMTFLSDYVAYAPSKVDMSDVKIEMGDYQKKGMRAAMDRQVIVGDVVGHYQKIAPGKRMLYFVYSVKASQRLADEFNKAGIPALHLDARDDLATRIDAAQRFARDELKVLTNVGLFLEGYDLAAQAGLPVQVEGVGLIRPTASESLAIQMMGRALRRKPYPALILDHANVIEQHHLPDTDRDWTLLGREKRKAKVATKVCVKCYAVIKASASECPYCGMSYTKPVTEGRALEHVDGELQRIGAASFNEARRSWSTIVGACTTLEEFREAAKKLGYKPGWAWHAWQEYQQHGYVNRRGRY